MAVRDVLRGSLVRSLAALVAAMHGSACRSASSRPSARVDAEAARPEHAHAHEDHAAGRRHHAFANAHAWTSVFDDPARDAWQHPEDVLRALELTPSMRVADIGAGTGYFAVRLSRAVSEGEVIAIDVEPEMVRYLNERAQREGLANLRAIRGNHAASGLPPASVDRILLVHVWHHLADRVAYARDMAAALAPGGKLLVVEFDPSADRGPPAHLRVAPDELIADLEAVGLAAELSSVPLPDQYILEASAKPRPGNP